MKIGRIDRVAFRVRCCGLFSSRAGNTENEIYPVYPAPFSSSFPFVAVIVVLLLLASICLVWPLLPYDRCSSLIPDPCSRSSATYARPSRAWDRTTSGNYWKAQPSQNTKWEHLFIHILSFFGELLVKLVKFYTKFLIGLKTSKVKVVFCLTTSTNPRDVRLCVKPLMCWINSLDVVFFFKITKGDEILVLFFQ